MPPVLFNHIKVFPTGAEARPFSPRPIVLTITFKPKPLAEPPEKGIALLPNIKDQEIGGGRCSAGRRGGDRRDDP